jgi:hypothetical protein
MAKGNKTTPKSDAEKAAKFRELASKRMTRILRGIAGLAKLSATARYKYSPQDVDKMANALSDACKVCLAAYQSGGLKGEGGGFKF